MTCCISHKKLLHTRLASLQELEWLYPAFLAMLCQGLQDERGPLVPPSPWPLGPHLLHG